LKPDNSPWHQILIEFINKSEAEKAIASLNGKSIKGRNITVNEVRPRTDNRGGGSGGGFSRRY
jgi:cold-inducible RNA-binding protein